MLTAASLLAAMTIAGAFWVGVLAARRLRDWGDGRRMLEEGGRPQLALSAGGSVDDGPSRRVRSLVAERLQGKLGRGGSRLAERGAEEVGDGLTLDGLRVGDVAVVEAAESGLDGDYLVEGVVQMREGAASTFAVSLVDGARRRWLVGNPVEAQWLLLTPAEDHGLVGEPPRNLDRDHVSYALERRGQASVAAVGNHGRPVGTRVSTYYYKASGRRVLWLERWGDEVMAAEGVSVPAHVASFLPGS